MHVDAEHGWVKLVKLVPVAHNHRIVVLRQLRHVAPLLVLAAGVGVQQRVTIIMETIRHQQKPLAIMRAHVRRRRDAVCNKSIHNARTQCACVALEVHAGLRRFQNKNFVDSWGRCPAVEVDGDVYACVVDF